MQVQEYNSATDDVTSVLTSMAAGATFGYTGMDGVQIDLWFGFGFLGDFLLSYR